MYQVLARKWRPQDFDALVGQPHIARTLSNAVSEDRIAHAYLFAGLRGTGKTTVARVLAKCLNCVKGPTPTPCGECDACREIAESRAMDVLEIDAASRTKVEQTRELLEMISYAPVRDRFKVLIIDEAHMLSKASFNALLKTLEEPPPNVVFILATTELEKVLPTIVSRCQVFEFRRVGARELADHLGKLCEAESIAISRDGLERIARAGDGSVRDSLSVLERVIAFCGTQVADEELLRMLGGVRSTVLVDFVRGLAARDASTMLAVLDGIVDEGHDLLHFWNELVSALRDLILMRAVPADRRSDLLGRSDAEAEAVEAAAEGLGVEDLSRAFGIVADLEPALRGSSRPRFMFEAALVRLSALGAVRPIEEVLRALGPGAAQPAGSAPGPAPRREPPPPPSAARTRPAPATPAAEKKNPSGGAGAAVDLRGSLVSAVLDAKPMTGAILEQASEIVLDGDRLHVRFEAGAGLAGSLEREETRRLIEGTAAALAGRPVRLEVGSGTTPARAEAAAPDAPAPAPAPAAPAGGSDARRRQPATRKRTGRAAPAGGRRDAGERDTLLEHATGEPGVRKLLREFGAQVVDIRPLEAAAEEVGEADDEETR